MATRPSIVVNLLILTTLAGILFVYTNRNHQLYHGKSNLLSNASNKNYAVFGCSTPDNSSHRGFDYAFYLPLTALAWSRIGFQSLVLITGSRSQWLYNPALSFVLDSLAQIKATVTFIPASCENGAMLSQTSRIFAANLQPLPDPDYLITTDADLWPLRRQHFLPEGSDKKLVLVHSQCCGEFQYGDQPIDMYPMSHVGASAAIWRDIVNDNQQMAKDGESILKYFEKEFGAEVRNPVAFDSDNWYLDQKMMSIRIHQWMKRFPSDDVVDWKSDKGLSRIDRAFWDRQLNKLTSLRRFYDAHLIEAGFTPENWVRIRPLINLMYGNDSWKAQWSDDYARKFQHKIESL